MIDKYTFGGTAASERLSILLNEKYYNYTTKVSRLYHGYTNSLNTIFTMWGSSNSFKDCGIEELLELHRNQRIAIVDKSSIPTELKSYLKNVMLVSYRNKIFLIKSLIKLNEK